MDASGLQNALWHSGRGASVLKAASYMLCLLTSRHFFYRYQGPFSAAKKDVTTTAQLPRESASFQYRSTWNNVHDALVATRKRREVSPPSSVILGFEKSPMLLLSLLAQTSNASGKTLLL